jgi:hypothetical protein
MHLKADDLIILNEEGLNRYRKRNDENGNIYRVSWINEETMIVFVSPLNQEDKKNYLFKREYYRIATESEVKKYKMKNLF